MPDDVRISCASKIKAREPRRRVVYVGGASDSGIRWKLSEESAIAGIEAGRWNFFVREDGRSAQVVIATMRNGRKYLKTASDGADTNNLLSLPECP